MYVVINVHDVRMQMTGYLNYDVWHWVVGYLVDDLRINREFPQDPDVSTWCAVPSCEYQYSGRSSKVPLSNLDPIGPPTSKRPQNYAC